MLSRWRGRGKDKPTGSTTTASQLGVVVVGMVTDPMVQWALSSCPSPTLRNVSLQSDDLNQPPILSQALQEYASLPMGFGDDVVLDQTLPLAQDKGRQQGGKGQQRGRQKSLEEPHVMTEAEALAAWASLQGGTTHMAHTVSV